MDPILHHYDASPFSEKVRLMFGFKGLTWKSVHTPSIMPKPDLLALTGGYRRAPVLQIGADIYCDTRRITQLLDELKPKPALLRPDALGTETLAQWCDENLFFLCILAVMQPSAIAHFARALPADEAAGFAADRQKFMQGGTTRIPRANEAKPELALALERLEMQLRDGRPHLLGDTPCVADFAAFHPLWTVAGNPGAAPLLEPYAALGAWLARMAAIGHGTRIEIEPAEALDEARKATPRAIEKPEALELYGVGLGDEVEVAATDYGVEPTSGRLVHADLREFALRRVDERVGEVVVHFPRTGFRVDPDTAP